MGFPAFDELFGYKHPERSYLIGAFVVGLVAWTILLVPMTSPALYAN